MADWLGFAQLIDFIGLAFCLAGSALFDASQYEFFGQNVVEDLELGGLEDDEAATPVFGTNDEEYHLFDRGDVRFFIFYFLFTEYFLLFSFRWSLYVFGLLCVFWLV